MLQEKKASMISGTINNDTVAMEKLSPEDLQFLFRGTWKTLIKIFITLHQLFHVVFDLHLDKLLRLIVASLHFCKDSWLTDNDQKISFAG